MKKILILLSAGILMYSCISRKNLIYLQGEPVSQKEIREINDTPYKLQVHDIIAIEIKAEDVSFVEMFNKSMSAGANPQNVLNTTPMAAYLTGYSVDRQGNIRLPYIGEINVLGYTTKEVRVKIEENLKKYLEKGTTIYVTVRLQGIKYTVMGEVNLPGTKIAYSDNLSIIDAITDSGDVSDVGDRKNVEVIRISPSGDVKKFEIDLTNIKAVNSEIFFIKPNDYINVKPLRQKSWGTGTTGLQSLSTVISLLTLFTSTVLIIRTL